MPHKENLLNVWKKEGEEVTPTIRGSLPLHHLASSTGLMTGRLIQYHKVADKDIVIQWGHGYSVQIRNKENKCLGKGSFLKEPKYGRVLFPSCPKMGKCQGIGELWQPRSHIHSCLEEPLTPQKSVVSNTPLLMWSCYRSSVRNKFPSPECPGKKLPAQRGLRQDFVDGCQGLASHIRALSIRKTAGYLVRCELSYSPQLLHFRAFGTRREGKEQVQSSSVLNTSQ